MHSDHAPGYSAFFDSGFRVMSRLKARECKPASSPKPIPLSFDSVSSDIGLEDSPLKRTNRRKRILNLLLRSKSATTDENLSSSSYTSKPSEHHTASPISNLLCRRKSHKTAAANSISNDESGWLSSTSSIGSVDDDIDFMDLSIWPKCPLGFGGHPRAITEIGSQPEILDPFSSLPGSKSFFVDCNFPANASADEPRPTCRRRPVSSGPWPNRFSLESSTFSLSSYSRRNSLSFKPSSFMSNGTSCRSPSANFSFLQLPRVPRASKGMRERPASIALFPRASVYATIPQMDRPTKAEKRYFQQDLLHSSVAQPLREEPPTQSHSQPPQYPKHSSYTRPLPLIPQSPSISVSSPGDKYHSGSHYIPPEAETHEDCCSASGTVPFPISVPVPESQELDQLNDESVDASREQDSDDRSQTSELGEEALSSASDARVFFENQMEDVSKRMDWREFCIEVLDGRLN